MNPILPQTPVPPVPPVPPEIVVGANGPPVEAIVVVVMVVVGALLLAPLVRAWARRLERGGRGGVDDEARAELDALRARVAELETVEHRVMELEERMDFSERLLTQRSGEPVRRGDEP